ncbi:MAG: ribonuclease III [Deltaproteobacteria bacterium]|nr:ribonuclease III [Deltaproteobacteria bacterium]
MCPDNDALKALSGGKLPSYKSMSGLSLAFIGDAVYEVLVRQYVLSLGEARVQDLHRETVALVNAAFQAKAAEALADRLTEEELTYYKRGRNANSAHTPKNKSEAEYHRSTGFEALVGYLYLSQQFDRLRELFDVILQTCSTGSADQ